MSKSGRINRQPAFLLTSKPWRENSLWLEVFSREYGRVALLARSARTRGSELRGVLVPFVPFSASWFGKEELKSLHRAEWLGGWPQPQNRSLFSALYANELVYKLTAREDPQPRLFDLLHDTLAHICRHPAHAAALRRFEWGLLQENGLAPDTETDGNGNPLEAGALYRVSPESPVFPADGGSAPAGSLNVPGRVLQRLASGALEGTEDLQSALQLTRLLIDFRLPEGVKSRRLLQQLDYYREGLRGC